MYKQVKIFISKSTAQTEDSVNQFLLDLYKNGHNNEDIETSFMVNHGTIVAVVSYMKEFEKTKRQGRGMLM